MNVNVRRCLIFSDTFPLLLRPLLVHYCNGLQSRRRFDAGAKRERARKHFRNINASAFGVAVLVTFLTPKLCRNEANLKHFHPAKLLALVFKRLRPMELETSSRLQQHLSRDFV